MNLYTMAHAEFKCYHYFYVPNPETKTIMYGNASKSPLEKFLFTTLKHQSQEDDKVFFFYKNVKQRLKLAVLNCEPDSPEREW